MLGIGPHSSFLFFLPYSQRSQIGCLRQFYTWCRLSTNLECTSEICCMRLAENTGHKKSPKIRHLCTIAQVCRAISSQLRHLSTSGKKLSHSNYLLHMSSQYGELRPTNGWDLLAGMVWGTTAYFNGFHLLSSLLHQRHWTEVNQTLQDVWPSPGVVHYIYIFLGGRALVPAPYRILPGVMFTLRQSLAFRVFASLLRDTRAVGISQTLWHSAEGATSSRRAAIRLGLGPHSSLFICWLPDLCILFSNVAIALWCV